MAVEMYEVDTGVGYKHTNGRTLEIVGEQGDGEWFACEADSDECYAQGYCERDGDADLMQDEEGRQLAQLVTEEDWAMWAEKILAQ
ncbi:hypothetical protein UFOVP29_121 [uncultured Caudovirales phage]|uniref:Uncharacterized protein n=1 Tax=uncultured Caudovirales phage TaxID=2100421 RepID=A0A6J5KP74_9CAUD|nr:hypothetical protein UFOVP29_121 [uncultured Caudovirales phage]